MQFLIRGKFYVKSHRKKKKERRGNVETSIPKVTIDCILGASQVLSNLDIDTMAVPLQEEEEYEVIYISDQDEDGDEVHWVAISAAKPSKKETKDVIVISSDEEDDESDNGSKKDGDKTNEDQPMDIQVKTEEGTTIAINVFPHFLVGQVMWLAHPKMSPNYGYPWADYQITFEGRVLNECRTFSDYNIHTGCTLHHVKRLDA